MPFHQLCHMIQEIPIKCRKSAVFPDICANGTLSWGYSQMIVFLLIHGLVNHLLKGFWNWKERLLERWGDKERNGCSVVSEGHLLRGGPTRNTAGCQSESHRNHWRWTGKKWQAHKNSSHLYLSTTRIGGLFIRLSSVEACAVVKRTREKYQHWNYSLTDNCQID